MPFLKDRLILALLGLYTLAAWAGSAAYGAGAHFSLLLYSRPVLTTTALILSLFLGWLCFHTMIKIRPRRLTAWLLNDLKTRWLTRERLWQALPILFLFLFFISAFSSMKSMIPLINPYRWDASFAALDNALHLGHAPWEILQPLLGFPVVTFIVNVVYNLWFPVIFAALYWQIFTLKTPLLRSRFLFSFFLCWIVNGTVLAILFSSAGPCFYGRLLPGVPDPYTPLLEYLKTANGIFPIWALQTQDMLWGIYEKNGLAFGSGISAMPSVHVSLAWLLFLFGREKNRFWGLAFFIFFLFIMTGSVHLGWHYAVDGYLAMITTGLISLAGKRIYPARENDARS